MDRDVTLTIDLIEDETQFEQLRDEWNALLQDSAADNFFLTWEWLSTWWKHFSTGRTLRILAVRSGHTLAAIAPLALGPRRFSRLAPFRSLEFLGTGSVGSDYLDVIIRRGMEPAALRALADYLARGQYMMELAQFNRSDCHASALAARLSDRGWSLSETHAHLCPFIDLSRHSWPSYLATLGSEHRYNFQRRLKNLAKRFDLCFEQVSSDERRREGLSFLVASHNRRWQARGGSTAFHTPELIAFHQELSRLALERGWLRLFVLSLDGVPAASLYGFRYGDTFYFYQSGFDPGYGKQSVGLITMGLAIKSAIEEGVRDYDLLHGVEPYKFHWARQTRELGRLDLYPPRLRGSLYRWMMEFNRAARKRTRQLLQTMTVGGAAGGTRVAAWKWRNVSRSD